MIRVVRRSVATAALAALLAALLAGRAAGQEAELRLAAGAEAPVRVALRELAGAGVALDLTLAAGHDPGASVAVRRRSAAGVLGTLVLEGEGAVRLQAPAAVRAGLRARGALGPVALRLEGEAWGAPPERFAPGQDPGAAPFARGAALRLSADGRMSRLWLAGADLAVTRDAAGGLAWDVAVDARARRLLGRELDLTLAAEGRARPGEPGAALGAGVVWAPRRAPEVRLRAWLDAVARDGRAEVRPGVEALGTVRAGGGRVEGSLRARPAGPDRAPWWAGVAWRRAVGTAEIELSAVARTGGPAGSGVSVAAAAIVPLTDGGDAGRR